MVLDGFNGTENYLLISMNKLPSKSNEMSSKHVPVNAAANDLLQPARYMDIHRLININFVILGVLALLLVSPIVALYCLTSTQSINELFSTPIRQNFSQMPRFKLLGTDFFFVCMMLLVLGRWYGPQLALSKHKILDTINCGSVILFSFILASAISSFLIEQRICLINLVLLCFSAFVLVILLRWSHPPVVHPVLTICVVLVLDWPVEISINNHWSALINVWGVLFCLLALTASAASSANKEYLPEHRDSKMESGTV
jgi:hypothetical protein